MAIGARGENVQRSNGRTRTAGRLFAMTAMLLTLGLSEVRAADTGCAEYERLREMRDEALRKKNLPMYCKALDGLIRLHPDKQTNEASLACEARPNGVKQWRAVRAQVIETMKETYAEQCR